MEMRRVRELLVSGVVLLTIGLPQVVQADWETVIPGDSLTPTNFSTYWEWFYPWGDTHNGSAKMYIEQVTLDVSGTATIVAVTPDPESTWKYRSGAFNSVAWIVCNDHYPEWDIRGEFKAPTARGAWPAFWPTGAWGWPPEIDILEYKGDTLNWFNTYDGAWETKKVRVADAATAWHEYRCHLTKLNGTEVTVQFYLDGVLKATHTGSNFVGQPFDLIVNLQMEGSSGSPGPTSPTYYYARNIVVQRYAAPVPPGPPSAPTNLDAAFGDTEIALGWDPSPEWDVNDYTVSRGTAAGGPYAPIATNLTVCAYNDTGLTNGTTYYYVVTATDLDGNTSGTSNEALETPVTLYPLAVGNYSFELPGTTKQQNWENVPNWSSDSVASDSGVESDYPTTDGIWRGFLKSSDPSVWNLTGHTIASGEKLLLAVDAKSCDDFHMALYYDAGGSRVTVAAKTVHLGDDYAKYTLAFCADDVPAAVGRTVGLEFDNLDSATSWAGFDNVRLRTSIPPAPDSTPPSPNPMTWATVPYATGSGSIAMVATTAIDESGVEYYFRCTSGGGHDSGWQAGTFYQDTGLAPLTAYTYTVQARDRSPSLNQTAESTAESATTGPSGGGLPYADGFESGGLAAGRWTTSGTAEVKNQAAYAGSYGARISGTAWMETALDTSGYTSVHLKYVCRTFQLDGQSENEWFYAEWYDGSSWHTVNQMNVGSWTAYDHALGSGAANNPSFKIRFRVNANMSMERADIDKVEVTGS